MVEWEKAIRRNIVVDANIIIAALLGSRATLVILTSQNYYFYAPKIIVIEIKKHKEEICREIKKLSSDFDLEFHAILKFIILLDEKEYGNFMDEAEKLMEKRDRKDAVYLACALAVGADFIWTNDKDFTAQVLIPAKNTTQFIDENRG